MVTIILYHRIYPLELLRVQYRTFVFLIFINDLPNDKKSEIKLLMTCETIIKRNNTDGTK